MVLSNATGIVVIWFLEILCIYCKSTIFLRDVCKSNDSNDFISNHLTLKLSTKIKFWFSIFWIKNVMSSKLQSYHRFKEDYSL